MIISFPPEPSGASPAVTAVKPYGAPPDQASRRNLVNRLLPKSPAFQ
jgi:hypothetical protein